MNITVKPSRRLRRARIAGLTAAVVGAGTAAALAVGTGLPSVVAGITGMNHNETVLRPAAAQGREAGAHR